MTDASAIVKNSVSGKRPKKGGYLLLLIFSASHGIFHFMSQSFSVMLPTIKETFGINPVQVGVLITAKTLAGGLTSLPGGIVSDYFRQYRSYLMMACMVVFALGWLLISISPVYALLICGMMVVAVAGSIWHLPSLAELGLQFSKTRGAAMAIHGAGASIGDIFGPVITGILLGFFSWRGIISIYSIVPLMMAFIVIWVFRGVSNERKTETETEAIDLKHQLKTVKDIMKKTHIWRINVVAGFRGMCFDIIAVFFPLFMKEELGLNSKSIGLHFGLLWAIGIVTSPIMGYLSDRFGRKLVLVPALFYSSTLIVILALFGKGIMFTILLSLLGISIRSDYSILTATILDIAGDKVATTMLGILSFTRFVMAAVAPIIAGALYQYVGMEATLIFVAGLFAVSGIIFMTAKLER